MFKTETLTAFVQVAKYGSFTAAANAQGQTPMALSKQVSQLENRLAEPLFERSTRKVSLTEFGEAFLQRAQQILGQHDSLDSWLEARKGRVGGTLKVVTQSAQTYDETVFVWLAEFHQLYPDIELEFDIQESIIDINKDAHDIYWGISDYLGQQHPGLKCRSMWKADYGIFASSAYLNKYGTPQTPEELQKHRMIGHPHAQPGNVLVVNKTSNSTISSNKKQTEMEYQQLHSPIKTVAGHSFLAVQGLGLINALVDNLDIKAYLASGQLVPVLADYWYKNAEAYIYYQQVKFEQPKVRAFIDFFLSKRDQW
ncbi:MAG: LysR family transcriptional regulator [Algicola sp.]|nr:LysR family transcriptional regulator [Algicola sp.]